MKVTATKNPEKFEPVRLEIVFESQEELDFFGSMMNHVRVCNMEFHCNRFGTTFGEPIRKALNNYGANINRTDQILK